MLEDQMRQKMVSLWQEVLAAETALDEGDVDALGGFIESAGTMIDNHRMAKHMFTRHRVRLPIFFPLDLAFTLLPITTPTPPTSTLVHAFSFLLFRYLLMGRHYAR